MKIYFCVALGILLCAFSVNNTFAANIDNANPGETVTITVTVPGAQDVEFNPSTNVNILGESDATSFAVSGWHEQAVQKDSGQAYLMSADENKMFFMDISADGEAVPADGDRATNFANFKGVWNTL